MVVEHGNNANLGFHMVLSQCLWLLMQGSIRGMHNRENALLGLSYFIISTYLLWLCSPIRITWCCPFTGYVTQYIVMIMMFINFTCLISYICILNIVPGYVANMLIDH